MAIERITEILNGTLAPDPTNGAELDAYEARHSAVVHERALAMARRDIAMATIAEFEIEARLVNREVAPAIKVIADRMRKEAYDTYEDFCGRHPYPPEPSID